MKGPVWPFSDINIMNTEQSKVTKLLIDLLLSSYENKQLRIGT